MDSLLFLRQSTYFQSLELERVEVICGLESSPRSRLWGTRGDRAGTQEVSVFGLGLGRDTKQRSYATAALDIAGASATLFPGPSATAFSSARSTRLMTSVTMSTASNCWRTTASATPALSELAICFSSRAAVIRRRIFSTTSR